MKTMVLCGDCDGFLFDDEEDHVPCPTCGGTGEVEAEIPEEVDDHPRQ